MFIPIIFSCQSCKDKEKCCNDNTHRTISRYGHVLLNLCEQLMEINENKEEYKKRSLVEALNGVYKIYYHINELAILKVKKICKAF